MLPEPYHSVKQPPCPGQRMHAPITDTSAGSPRVALLDSTNSLSVGNHIDLMPPVGPNVKPNPVLSRQRLLDLGGSPGVSQPDRRSTLWAVKDDLAGSSSVLTDNLAGPGKIVESWSSQDRLGLFQQLGVVPATQDLITLAGLTP